MGLERLFIAVHADVAHTGGGHHAQHAVDQAETGAQDGDDNELLACERGGVHLADGGLDVLGGQREVARGLVGDEHTDLGHELAEILDAGVFIAHDGELVGDEGVVHDVYFLVEFGFHCFDLRKIIFKFEFAYRFSWPLRFSDARPARGAGRRAKAPARSRLRRAHRNARPQGRRP